MAATAQQRAFEIPDKAFFRIGEVSRLTATKQFVLRYWETEFPMLQPIKTPKGHRLYRREDIETVLEIRRLLYEEGFTIAGARRHLQGHIVEAPSAVTVRAVASENPPVREAALGMERGGRVDRKALEVVRAELAAILTLVEAE